jgi:hypothetical protein
MKTKIVLLILTCFAVLAFASEKGIPKVKQSYTMTKSTGYTGKQLKDIIEPGTIKLIAFTGGSGKGTPLTKTFTPDWDSDKLIEELFSSGRVSVEWGMDAMEAIFAEYTIVTDNGLFFLEICGSLVRQQPITAAILRGDGFACRFNINTIKETSNKASDTADKSADPQH